MNLQDKINEDLKLAMKARDRLRVETLRMLRAQFKDTQIAKRDELSEDEVLGVLNNAAKKRKEALEMYQKTTRTDLIEKEQKELEIISAYLPKQLSEEEISKVIDSVIKETGVTSIKEIGKVMASVMKQLKGKADGKLIQSIVREKLKECE